jgi:hypothetical protein
MPAKKGYIIKKIDSHYVSEIDNGEHFVVLDVYNGDDTAVVLKKDGTIGTLCFPEEYEVVGTIDGLLKIFNDVPTHKVDLDLERTDWFKNVQRAKRPKTINSDDEENEIGGND